MVESKVQWQKRADASHAGLPVLLLGGPTGSGKSGLALAVAEAFGGAVVNADSMQVYSDLRVLTDRPGEEAMRRAPHHLYGVLDGADPCSAGRWHAMAGEAIRDAAAKGAAFAVLVGGTGLYLRAAAEGLAPVPDIPPHVRGEVRARLAAVGEDTFRAELRTLDPAAAERIRTGDVQRLQRAREVVEATGRSLTDWQREDKLPPLASRVMKLVLLPPRPSLFAACDERYRAMIEAGAIEEVRILLERGLDPELPVMKAVGVREIAAYLVERADLETMIERGQRATRQYAKRQYTWFRHQLPDAEIIYEQYSESLLPGTFIKIRQFLLTNND